MPNAKSFTRTQRDTAAQNLAALPEKPENEHRLSTRDMVKSIQAHILSAQKKGYTFEEIADVISKTGVSVSIGTLKYALRVVAEEKSIRKYRVDLRGREMPSLREKSQDWLVRYAMANRTSLHDCERARK